MIPQRFKDLAAELGLTGAWMEVARTAISNRKIRFTPDYYFLCWDERAILWLEADQGQDSRIPPEIYWLWYWWDELSDWEQPKPAFRAGQEFPHREALMRTVGFYQYEGPFGLMRLVATPWEEK